MLLEEPKYKFITNHTARRSFCTNMFLRNIPPISIMSISGHKTEKIFLKYIKVDKDSHANIIDKSFCEMPINKG